MTAASLHHAPGPERQKGIATLLIVMLMGVALTATSLGIIHSVRSTQEKQVAVHAATHAQTGVWAGVEAFRRYLAALSPDEMNELMAVGNAEFSIEFGDTGDAYGSLKAQKINVTEAEGIYRVSAQIVNIHAAAQSSSALGVMYEVTPGGDCPGCIVLSNHLDFYDDLLITGGIELHPSLALLSEGTSGVNLNVDGNVTFQSIGIKGVGRIAATGDVKMDSGMEAEQVYANGNVTLSGSAVVQKVEALGTVTTSGQAGAINVWANGNLILGGSLESNAANSRGKISVGGGSYGLLKARGEIAITNGSTFGDVMSADNINVSQWVSIQRIIGEKSLSCPGTGWNKAEHIVSISLNLTLGDKCDLNMITSGKASVLQKNSIDIMNELPPFELPPTEVDVWALKSKANYILEWDQPAGRPRVTVQNINGLADGVYHIGKYGDKNRSYLCKDFEMPKNTGNCTSPALKDAVPICLGNSTGNDCLSYNTGTRQWTFSGTATAPGIIWVDGNLNLGQGKNYSTFLVTGNIVTSSDLEVRSVNYSGLAGICRATGAELSDTMRPIFNARFKDFYPSNLCTGNTANDTYKPIPTGNIALAAGGYDPSRNREFSGGDIHLKSKNTIYGAVLAGHYLQTEGDTTVHGYVMASAQGKSSTIKNQIGAKTVIDLRNLPDTYAPNIVPDMNKPCLTGCEQGGDGEESRLLWSRYL